MLSRRGFSGLLEVGCAPGGSRPALACCLPPFPCQLDDFSRGFSIQSTILSACTNLGGVQTSCKAYLRLLQHQGGPLQEDTSRSGGALSAPGARVAKDTPGPSTEPRPAPPLLPEHSFLERNRVSPGLEGAGCWGVLLPPRSPTPGLAHAHSGSPQNHT